MYVWLALMGALPLLAFAVADSFMTMKKALLVAVLIAVVEAAISYSLFGEFDIVTGFSVLTIGVLAVLSLKKESPLFFKMQPVVLGVMTSVLFVGSYIIQRPLFYELIIKYRDVLLEKAAQFSDDLGAIELLHNRLYDPIFLEYLKGATLMLGLTLCIHAGLVAYAALKMSKWWWLGIRVVGLYVAMIAAALLTALTL